MVHSEVYLNNVVSIAPFSTPACPDCSQNIQKTALYAVFAFQFFIHFPGGSADPICHYRLVDAHARTCCGAVAAERRRLLSVDISCPRGDQQQTR